MAGPPELDSHDRHGAIEATLAPLRKADVLREPRTRATSGQVTATITKPGRKMPMLRHPC